MDIWSSEQNRSRRSHGNELEEKRESWQTGKSSDRFYVHPSCSGFSSRLEEGPSTVWNMETANSHPWMAVAQRSVPALANMGEKPQKQQQACG